MLKVLERAPSWPEASQKKLERLALEIEAELAQSAYRVTPVELAGIDRGLAAANAGQFASDEEIAALFAK